ncbi:hypothetical protein KEM55_006852, partial [Ascosphaera atra]
SVRYLASQWDPSYEAEDVDWYSEYVARNAPISMHWLQTPGSGPGREGVPVKGLALMKDTSYDARDMAVLPLEDGTVCIWDLNRATRNTQRYMRGSMLNVSKPGLLFSRELKRPDKSILKTPVNDFVNAGDLVSVNSKDRKAYIAVGDTLNVLDIERLTVVARQPFPRLIFALSQETDYEVPISVASLSELSVYDPRLPTTSYGCMMAELLDTPSVKSYTILHQPGPLSVLHPPQPNTNSILVAGRFPSILLYDRRNLSQVQDTAFTSASLCGLSAIPAPVKLPLGEKHQNIGDHQTIVACGEYKGRGSLEFFALHNPSQEPSSADDRPHLSHNPLYQNRYSASRSKILSVANHGTRIVFSDANGFIRWMERDGRSGVRNFNLSQHLQERQQRRKYQSRRKISQIVTPPVSPQLPPDLQRLDRRSDATQLIHDPLETDVEDEDTGPDVARKVLPTGSNNVPDDELLVWTGEQVGRLRFGVREQVEDESDEEQEMEQSEARERHYQELMRRSWVNYTNEMNFLRGLGLS